MKTKQQSVKFMVILFAVIVFAVVILSNIYILLVTSRIQDISNQRFSHERELKSLQDELTGIQENMFEFLSSKSSTALSLYLADSQALRQKMLNVPGKTHDSYDLREREVFSLITWYLTISDNAVQGKRGRNIALYTAEYERMTRLMEYINTEIDDICLNRFRNQLVDYEAFIDESKRLHMWTLVLLLDSAILALFSIVAIVNQIVSPLNKLVETSKRISDGEFDAPDIQSGQWREINGLIDAFNRMKNDISIYIKEVEWKKNVEQDFLRERLNNMKMQQLIKRMELYTMQAQMNPHFLFNTLNTGVQLAIVENADRTSEYMGLLARLFRHNLSVKEVIVPLRHEMEGLEAYFGILQIRFPKTLDIQVDVPEELLDCQVPVSILQPMAENSIVHAFKNKTDVGTISVMARKNGQILTIEVADNGCGMEQQTVDRLLEKVPADSATSKVMGLENVIQRLYFFYPDNQDVIKIDSAPGKGTKIDIAINLEDKPCIQF